MPCVFIVLHSECFAVKTQGLNEFTENAVHYQKMRRLMDEASLPNHHYSDHRPVKQVVMARIVVRAGKRTGTATSHGH